ncbi:MAG: STT3 domain-containing protein [archaeon]
MEEEKNYKEETVEHKSEEDKIIEERKKKFMQFIKNKKSILAIVGLIILLFLAWHIRTVNVENLKDITTGDYTLGPDLDPFLFLRYAKYIVTNGGLMELDMMRYVPLGYPTAGETQLLPYMIAYFHKVLNFFSPVTVNYSAVIFPVFMFLLTVIAFFLFIRKVFEDNKYCDLISLISTAFLIVSPSLLSRTVAGIPEKESAGFLFMFVAFYFFISAWKSNKLKSSLTLAGLAGLSTGIMGLIWGGWIYIFVVISLFMFVAFFLEKTGKKEFYIYSIWLILSVATVMILYERYTLKGLIYSTSSGLSFIVFAFLLVDFLIFNTKLKDIKFIKGLSKKYPKKLVSIIFSAILAFMFSIVFLGISFIPNFFGDVISHLSNPYSDRLSFTVAENRQPYFGEWAGSFGPIVKGFPLFFWLFFVGSILLFYESVKKLRKDGKYLLVILYIIFLFGLIFSRYDQNSLMNGANNISKLVYYGSFILLMAAGAYLYYKYYKEDALDEFKKINFSYLFLLAFFFTSLIGARSAVRLIMVLAPPAAGIVGFFTVSIIEKIKSQKDETMRMTLIVIAVLVVLSVVYGFYFNYKSTEDQAMSMVPSIYTQQWQKAMEWVRLNTPEDAVFAHWWDYGYWIQSIGDRATVLDGGNSISYWNHLIGRHVLTSPSEEDALEFLYSHNTTHFLIDSTDIGKYPAYSMIGSDPDYDRSSYIPVVTLIDYEETRNGTRYLYSGNIGLDEDVLWETNNGQILLPAGIAGIGGIELKTENNIVLQPEAILIYKGQQQRIPLRYLYINNILYDYEQGFEAGIVIFQRLDSESGGGLKVNELGGAIYLSPRTVNGLMARLYLMNDNSKGFKLVHEENNLIIESLRSQGLNLGSFVLYQGSVLGPIKIWEIEYPEGIKINPDYLDTAYPDDVRLHKQ